MLPPTNAFVLAGEMINDLAYIASGLVLLLLSWSNRRLADRYKELVDEQKHLRESIERLEWNAGLAPIRRSN